MLRSTNKKIVQLPLFGTIRIKKTGVSAEDIKEMKLYLRREGSKILGIIIKHTEEEKK